MADSAFEIACKEPASSNTGRVLTLHTARKRSKASLLNLAASEEAAAADGGGASSCAGGLPTVASGRLPTFVALPLSRAASTGRDALLMAGGSGAADAERSASAAWRLGAGDYCDWAVVLLAIIVLAASEHATPRTGYIPKAVLSDTNYPMRPNSVPAWSVPVYSLLAPAILLTLHTVVLRRPPLEAHHLVLGLFTSVLVTAAVTNLIKCPVGRLRPDFNARCWPDGKMAWEREDPWGGYVLCSGSAADVDEGRKSFPSGHSSWSAAGLCYLTWWLLDRLGPFDGSGHPWRLAVSLLPAGAALAVGISRYTDYWHHASDVAAGLLLGGAVSWVCYRQQRCRLAELDAASYGSGGAAGQRLALAGTARSHDDGAPLLYQTQQQALPV